MQPVNHRTSFALTAGVVVLTLVAALAWSPWQDGSGPLRPDCSTPVAADAAALDPSFGQDGVARLALPESATASAVAVQPDGRLVVAGNVGDNATATRFLVARFTADGMVDPTFGDGGVVQLSFLPHPWSSARAVAVQADGRIVVAGAAGNFSEWTGKRVAVARLMPDGTPDPSFGMDGRVVSQISGGAGGVSLGPDRKIVVAGQAILEPPGLWPIASAALVMRLLPDGRPDPGFGLAGVSLIQVPGGDTLASGLVRLPDGRLLLTGRAEVNGRNGDFLLAQLLPDGTRDPSFGRDGLVVTDLDDGDEGAASVALTADGQIMVTGGTLQGSEGVYLRRLTGTHNPDARTRLVVARFQADGSPDAGWGTSGRVVVAEQACHLGAGWLTILADGSVIIAGHTAPSSYDIPNHPIRWLALRFLATGQPDRRFGVDGRVIHSFDRETAFAHAVTADAGQRIIVVGRSNRTNVFSEVTITRYR